MMLKARRVNGVKSASEADHPHAPIEPHTCHLFTISILCASLPIHPIIFLPFLERTHADTGRTCKLRK